MAVTASSGASSWWPSWWRGRSRALAVTSRILHNVAGRISSKSSQNSPTFLANDSPPGCLSIRRPRLLDPLARPQRVACPITPRSFCRYTALGNSPIQRPQNPSISSHPRTSRRQHFRTESEHHISFHSRRIRPRPSHPPSTRPVESAAGDTLHVFAGPLPLRRNLLQP